MKRTILIIVIFLLIPAFFAQAELSKKDKYLILSAELGQIDDVKTALNEFRADINADGTTAIIGASGTGHTEVVKLLLSKGVNVNAKSSHNGSTALLWAS